MPAVTLEQLLAAGVHFGHLTRRWNPKMKPYIFMTRNGIHILDLKKTQQALDKALKVVYDVVSDGYEVMFVGTKPQAKDIIKSEAERCNMFYVTHRWLGGMLTNFATIKKSIKHYKNLEKMSSDGTYDKISKKERLMIDREKEKLYRVLSGILEMKRLPGLLFVVDINKEHLAVHEARKMNIPIVAMVDTNVDPTLVDYPIPANDDAAKSISLITSKIADTIIEARQKLQEKKALEEAVEKEKKKAQQPKEHKHEVKDAKKGPKKEAKKEPKQEKAAPRPKAKKEEKTEVKEESK
ncbi:30S ribosomal protein S2 [candidate division KSB1 bacterium]|nr:MAG: 30S ribosomal protein S2 [candidate division KSB1 bacterium]